jgi:hypothetical protein
MKFKGKKNAMGLKKGVAKKNIFSNIGNCVVFDHGNFDRYKNKLIIH